MIAVLYLVKNYAMNYNHMMLVKNKFHRRVQLMASYDEEKAQYQWPLGSKVKKKIKVMRE